MPTPKNHFTTTRARDVMTHDVITVYANQQLSTAAEVLADRQITGVPVVSYEDTCVGILSTKDFPSQNSDDIGASDVGASDVGAGDIGASDVGASDVGASDVGASDVGASDVQVFKYMTTPAITVSESHSLFEVAAIMRSNRIHRVPVVDDRGRVVGILGTLDLVAQIVCAVEVDQEAAIC